MPSKDLLDAWDNYKLYHDKKLIVEKFNQDEWEKFIPACVEAVKCAYNVENEIEFGKSISPIIKGYIEEIIKGATNGTFDLLEDWAQQNKQNLAYINWYYDILKAEAPYLIESYKLYIERDRLKKDRFYEPRRKTLSRISSAVQRLEDGELDVLFLHQPPRTGKSGDITMDVSWHCARDTELSNLYVTYKEGLGGAFLDGVTEIYTDPTYRFRDVFPDVVIKDTDAKNNKLDLNRKKKYKTLSGKGLESGLNGEYDATGWLIIDDPLEGVQDVMSPEVLKRKQTIFDNNVLSRRKEHCKTILIGTIWSVNDIFMNYLNFLEENKGNIKMDIIKIPALDPETDESNFNYAYGVGFSTEHYRRLRAKHEMNDDMAGWWAQYQQEPIERDGQVFNPEHMRYYSVLPEKPLLKIIAHCDVALGGGDFLSFPIVYCFEDGTMYCEDVVFNNAEKHVTQPEVVAKIISHNIKNIHFEANQGGEGYKDDIKRLLGESGFRDFNITSDWAPSTQRKEQRIWDRAEAIREIYFKDPQHRHGEYKKFMQNLFSFTMVHNKRRHDDASDSLAGLIDFDRKGSGVATVQAVSNPFRRG